MPCKMQVCAVVQRWVKESSESDTKEVTVHPQSKMLICCPYSYVKSKLMVQISLSNLFKILCPRNCDQKVTICLICTVFSLRIY